LRLDERPPDVVVADQPELHRDPGDLGKAAGRADAGIRNRRHDVSFRRRLARELRDQLVRDGSLFHTSSDTEVVLHLYARSREHTVEDALIESISEVRGAFSFVLLTKDRLIAARDPHGFRPLALGRLGDAHIVCSETCALDLIGATYVRDVEPGELLVIGEGGVRSLRPFPAAPLAH